MVPQNCTLSRPEFVLLFGLLPADYRTPTLEKVMELVILRFFVETVPFRRMFSTGALTTDKSKKINFAIRHFQKKINH